MSEGPDFICIGMQKAGTGWLFDQLQYHPDFWMPPTKEIHYLDREIPLLKNATGLLEKARKKPDRLEKRFQNFRRRWDERDMQFLEEAEKLSGQPRDLDNYARLFRFKRDRLSGDVTPGYSGLEEDVIAQIAARFPDTRILFLIRDPVSRAWSQISMNARHENFREELLEPEKFAKYLTRTNKFDRVAYPARTAERWDRAAPQMRFQHIFFDDIAERPEEARAQVLNFIGGDPAKSSGELEAGHNKKSNAAKLTLTDELKALMIEFFADEIRASAKRFGGHAIGWAEKYGVPL